MDWAVTQHTIWRAEHLSNTVTFCLHDVPNYGPTETTQILQQDFPYLTRSKSWVSAGFYVFKSEMAGKCVCFLSLHSTQEYSAHISLQFYTDLHTWHSQEPQWKLLLIRHVLDCLAKSTASLYMKYTTLPIKAITKTGLMLFIPAKYSFSLPHFALLCLKVNQNESLGELTILQLLGCF